ncbi:MAG: hypothetical protein ACI4U1_05145 [Anaerovoracaceae bacterium]
MKNKNVFSISPALLRENLKLCWYLPALVFVLYFFVGIFPIIINLPDLSSVTDYIEESLNNYNIIYPVYMAGIPLVAAMLMMSFFHKPAKALAMHSQPYSRAKLFNSHVLAGWIMCILPVFVTAILYLNFMNDIYTFSDVIRWLASSIGIITFFYGMYIFAGSLTGNSAMHLLLSGLFFVIVPVLLILVSTYCESYINGFVSLPDYVSDAMRCFNPLIMMLTDGMNNVVAVRTTLTYMILGLVFIGAGSIAYRLAKLENVGDSVIFRTVEEIITYLVVFVGMTIFGFFFQSFDESTKGVLILGMVTGTLITFFITKVVIARSVKIFNMKNLKSLGIYVAIAAVFTAFTVYDISGISKRLPELEQIESVNCEYMFDSYEMDYFAYGSFRELSDIAEITSPTVISKVYELHKYIVENDLPCEQQRAARYDMYGGEVQTVPIEYVSFEYEYKNGCEFKRRFYVMLDDKAAQLIDDIITDPDFKKTITLSDKIPSELYDDSFATVEYGGETVIISGSSEIKKLIEAYDRDVYNSNYMDIYKPTVSDGKLSAEDEMLSEMDCVVYIIFPNGKTDSGNTEIWFHVDESTPEVWKYLSQSGIDL